MTITFTFEAGSMEEMAERLRRTAAIIEARLNSEEFVIEHIPEPAPVPKKSFWSRWFK